jgi:tryptophan-rich sensory protein
MDSFFKIFLDDNHLSTLYRALLFYCLVIPWSIPIVGNLPKFKSTPTDGAVVAWRNSSWMYGLVWFSLLVLINVASVLFLRSSLQREAILFAVLLTLVIASCIGWMVLYHMSGKHAGINMFLLLLLVLSIMIPFVYHSNSLAGSLLAPLFVWASFQLSVNIQEVIEQKQNPVK